MMEHGEQIEAVQRMQDYIDQHLTEDITLHTLAQQAGYSPWHCAKIFKEFTGKSPFEYMRMYRLSQAALKLRDDSEKIVDVAMDFVFDSHEGFTRAFRKQFGVSPKDYKKHTPPVYLFQPWSIRDYYAYLDRKAHHETVQLSQSFYVHIRDFPKRKLIVKRGIHATNYFEYINEVSCDVWGLLSSIKEALYEPIGMWLPETLRPSGTSSYAQGVEVPFDYTGPVPDDFDKIDLPACQMMLFQGEPYDEDHFEDAIGMLSKAIDHYNPTAYGYEWADHMAPRIQLEPQGYRGYIEARPVQEINP